MRPLAGLKVVDLTHHIAGPYSTLLLAQYGAEVVKIERPGVGDVSRSLGPFLRDDPNPETSGLFLHLNRGKKSVTLNLKHPMGRELLLRLVEGADVVVESFRPGVMASLGLDYDQLRKVNQAVVLCSISNFGQTGPYRDWKATDMVFFGTGGAMLRVGEPDRGPIKMAENMQLYHAGILAATAILSAATVVETQNVGQYIDLSIFEASVGSPNWRRGQLADYAFSGRAAPPRGTNPFHGYPEGVFPCKDGYVGLVSGGEEHFTRACFLIERPELAADGRFATKQAQEDPARKEQFLSEYFLPWLRARSKEEVLGHLLKSRTLGGAIHEMSDVVNFVQFRERGAFEEIDHPAAGHLLYPGAPIHMSDSSRVSLRAPLLGEHNREVLGPLGYRGNAFAKLKQLGVT